MLHETENIEVYYGDSHILKGVSVNVDSNEIVSLLGRNGAGKTTTLKSIMGFLRPRSGRIYFAGQEIAGLPPFRINKLGIGWVPEERRIFNTLSVLENLMIGHQKSGGSRVWSLDKIYHYFPTLSERKRQLAGTLSGGEQQMLAIARALMNNPKLLLLDEPTEGLSPGFVGVIRQIIQGMKENGLAVLLVDQNIKLALNLADRYCIIIQGKVVCSGENRDYEESYRIVNRHISL